ncbi:hypothetical protein AAGS61_16180 [Lysinibacillus sp. KU-BSD001]|uniref:hypothetical protein n=1 Tax=Lysinibacillus sp. KU-BSD001 TaxID=3141328 RepID=UPI0036E82C03
MAKKMKSADDFIHHLYIHMNDVDQFVIYSGLSFRQFFSSIEPMKNILLLKHNYEDGSFNMHTQFDYIATEDMTSFMKRLPDIKGDFCWIDFSSEKNVNQLSPVEQAELLYFGHKREPLASPFFSKLQNRYAYYASPNDKMTKVYFRFLGDSELLTANLFNKMIHEKEGTGSFWRRKSKQAIPTIDPIVLRACRHFVKEGALLSLFKMEKSSQYGIEIRTLSDYNFPDEVWVDLNEILKQNYDELIKIS